MGTSISSLSTSDSLLSSLAASSSSTASLLSSGNSTASSSAGTDAVTVDLSDFAKAASSGDSSGKAAALMQLKTDLSAQVTALVASADGSDSSASSIGDQVLSTVYGTLSSTNTNSALSDVQSLAAQSGQTSGTLVDTTA